MLHPICYNFPIHHTHKRRYKSIYKKQNSVIACRIKEWYLISNDGNYSSPNLILFIHNITFSITDKTYQRLLAGPTLNPNMQIHHPNATHVFCCGSFERKLYYFWIIEYICILNHSLYLILNTILRYYFQIWCISSSDYKIMMPP